MLPEHSHYRPHTSEQQGANFELRIANRTGEGTEKCGEVVVQ